MDVNLNLADNINRIRPLLGIGLVLSVALFAGYTVFSRMDDLASDLNSALPKGVEGSIVLQSATPVTRTQPIHFTSDVFGDTPATARTYITMTCFQGERLVFGQVAKQGASFHINDPQQTSAWSDGSAVCSAALMYQVMQGSVDAVFMVDSVSFEVAES
jgi:hypothetical protein